MYETNNLTTEEYFNLCMEDNIMYLYLIFYSCQPIISDLYK